MSGNDVSSAQEISRNDHATSPEEVNEQLYSKETTTHNNNSWEGLLFLCLIEIVHKKTRSRRGSAVDAAKLDFI